MALSQDTSLPQAPAHAEDSGTASEDLEAPETSADSSVKKTKAEALYRITRSPGVSCHTCEHRIDQGDKPSTCALVQGTVDPEHVCDLFHLEPAASLAAEAFVNGYAIHGHTPLTHRARVAHVASKALAVEYHHPMVLRFVEAQGATEGLYAKVYKRRDRLWMKYDIHAKRWSKKLSMQIPPDLFAAELDKAYQGAPADTKKQRTAVRDTALSYLISTLAEHPELDQEVRAISTAADAEGEAEGSAAAEAFRANLAGEKVPNLPDLVAANLRKIQARHNFGQNTSSIKTALLTGLAGDVAIHYVAVANENGTDNQKETAAIGAVGAGVGASYYLDLNIHTAFAAAMLALYAAIEGGQKVDFTTVGDEKVCPLCIAAEDGNPYSAGNAPPIPLHGGCRCWYTPAE